MDARGGRGRTGDRRRPEGQRVNAQTTPAGTAGVVFVLGHRPGLDGLRGLAVAAVLVAHSEVHGPLAMAGVVGVTVFFVLSGFLITKLLLEQDRPSLRGFYARRAQRLLPALPLALLLCGVASAAMGLAVWGDLAAVVFYSSNIAQLGGADGGAFRHMWSLAVEEHFYAVWPLVVVLWRRQLLPICLTVSALIVAARMVGPWADETMYRATPLRLDAMLLGAALAVWMHRQGLPDWRGWPAWGIVAAASISLPMDPWMRWVAPAVAVAAVVLVASQANRPTLTHPALRRLGVISYGVYLFHYPVSILVRRQWDGWTSLAVTVVLTLAIAEVSYRVVEARFLHRRGVEVAELGGAVDRGPSRYRARLAVADAAGRLT